MTVRPAESSIPSAGSVPWPGAWSRLVILTAVALLTARLLEVEPLQSANDRSRWATVWSIVERGTYQIDEIRKVPGWDTIDKVRHEGHFYSSKPPLLSTMLAGMYWTVKRTLGWNIIPNDLDATSRVGHLILWFVNILPTAIALECLGRLVWRQTAVSFTRAFVLIVACFGTLWSAYLPSLNNHTPALCCVMLAIAAVVGEDDRADRPLRYALAGLFAGLATVFELPAAAFLAFLGLWLGWKSPRKMLMFYATAAALPIAAHFYTNYLATGSWKPFYAAYGTEKYLYVDEGIPSYWLEPKGVDKALDSFWTYLLHCTVGHHGLLSLTPVLLLSLWGALRFPRWRLTTLAPVHVMGIALTGVVFGFYLSRPEHYNYGGVSVGLRWMIWLVPFWLLLLIPVCDSLARWKAGRGLAGVLLAASIFSAWHPFEAPWRQPWLFDWMQDRGWIDYREPPPEFPKPVRSWVYQLPESPGVDPDYWVELTGTDLDGTPLTLRVADGGPMDDGRARRVDFTWNLGRANERVVSAVIDVARFNAGDAMANCLIWGESASADGEKDELIELLQGTPLAKAYDCRAIRYLKLGLRTDAFRCYVGTAVAGRRSVAPGISAVAIRSEAWLCPEIPFGVAIWDTQTTNFTTRSMLASRRLTAIRAGRLLETTP